MNLADLIYNIFSVSIGGAVTFLFTRRKSLADARKTEFESIQMAINIWKELAEGLQEKVEQLNKQIVKLDGELQNMRKENNNLKTEVSKLRKSINETNKGHE